MFKACWYDKESRMTRLHPAWKNLANHAYRFEIGRIRDPIIIVNTELAKFNGVNIPNSGDIMFDAESDAIQFMLTWG